MKHRFAVLHRTPHLDTTMASTPENRRWYFNGWTYAETAGDAYRSSRAFFKAATGRDPATLRVVLDDPRDARTQATPAQWTPRYR